MPAKCETEIPSEFLFGKTAQIDRYCTSWYNQYSHSNRHISCTNIISLNVESLPAFEALTLSYINSYKPNIIDVPDSSSPIFDADNKLVHMVWHHTV